MQIRKTLYKILWSFNLTFYISNREQNERRSRGDQENLSYMVFRRDMFIGYYCPLMLKSNIAILQLCSLMSRNYEMILYFFLLLYGCFSSYDIKLSMYALYSLHEVVFSYLKDLNNHSAE